MKKKSFLSIFAFCSTLVSFSDYNTWILSNQNSSGTLLLFYEGILIKCFLHPLLFVFKPSKTIICTMNEKCIILSRSWLLSIFHYSCHNFCNTIIILGIFWSCFRLIMRDINPCWHTLIADYIMFKLDNGVVVFLGFEWIDPLWLTTVSWRDKLPCITCDVHGTQNQEL